MFQKAAGTGLPKLVLTSGSEEEEGLRLLQCAAQDVGACLRMVCLPVSPWLTLQIHPLLWGFPPTSILCELNQMHGLSALLSSRSLGSLQMQGCWESGQ